MGDFTGILNIIIFEKLTDDFENRLLYHLWVKIFAFYDHLRPYPTELLKVFLQAKFSTFFDHFLFLKRHFF